MINDNLNGHLSRNYTQQSVLLIDIIVCKWRLSNVFCLASSSALMFSILLNISHLNRRHNPNTTSNLIPDFVCNLVHAPSTDLLLHSKPNNTNDIKLNRKRKKGKNQMFILSFA